MRVLFIVLGLIVAACAVPRHSRIVGGDSTSIEKYPYMAGMLRRSWLGHFFQSCGGTLISNSAVVSASHCFSGIAASSLRVRLGSSYANSGGKEHLVSRIIIHPQYNARLLINDIAVIKLSDRAVFSKQVNRARIAGPFNILKPNSVVSAIGWGDMKYKGEPSEVLQHVQVNVIDPKICAERYAYLRTLPGLANWPAVTPEMICTGILDVGGKDACQGDSGGPVIQNRNILVGVTSWGYECAHAVYPGVSVRVSSYTDWIFKNSL